MEPTTLGIAGGPTVEQSSAADARADGSIAAPLKAGDISRRAGDLPYWRQDQRWLRSYLWTINARAKFLVRNNRHAATAARELPTRLVGAGIDPMLPEPQAAVWRAWSSKRKRIHVSRRLGWQGLQWLAARSVMVTGEAFVVLRRMRMQPAPGMPPVRLEVFDAEGLSTTPGKGMQPRAEFEQGREVGPGGRTVAWHFRVANGSRDRYVRVPASDVVHIYNPDDCAAERGLSWFSPIVIDLNELSGYQDSTAVKQHMAAKVTWLTSDIEDLPPGSASTDEIENLEPGAEMHVPPGRQVQPFQGADTKDYADFVKINRNEIAVCLGVQPEVLSGDYSGMSWTVARASYLESFQRDEGHRTRWLVPAWQEVYDWVRWAMGGAQAGWPEADEVDWRTPIMRAIDPPREGVANERAVNNRFKSWSDVVRESGRNPERLMIEIADERERMAALGILPGEGAPAARGSMERE